MAQRDKSQGYGFILSSGVKTFPAAKSKYAVPRDEEPALDEANEEYQTINSIYDVIDNAIELLETSTLSTREIIDALIDDLKKFR